MTHDQFGDIEMVKDVEMAPRCDEIGSAIGLFGSKGVSLDAHKLCEMDAGRFAQLYSNPCQCKRPENYKCLEEALIAA